MTAINRSNAVIEFDVNGLVISVNENFLETMGYTQDEVLGNETRVKVVKNKVAPPFKTADFEIIYGEGVSRIGEVIDLATKNDILEKSGSWYAFEGTKIGQGRDNAKKFIVENPDIMNKIAEKVRSNLGMFDGDMNDIASELQDVNE